jgi:hypothetical protein
MDGFDSNDDNRGGYHGYDGGGGNGNGNDDDGYRNDARSRDFLPHRTPLFPGAGGAVFPEDTQGYGGCSGLNRPRLGIESLDLNDSVDWPGMQTYQGILGSGNDGLTMAPPPPHSCPFPQ